MNSRRGGILDTHHLSPIAPCPVLKISLPRIHLPEGPLLPPVAPGSNRFEYLSDFLISLLIR